MILLRFWKPIAAGLAILAVLLLAYRWAYERGENAARAHYEPILAAIEKEAAAAKARVLALEQASERITADIEVRHAEAIRAVEDRARDAERRYADLLRTATHRHECGVSEVPDASRSTHEAAGESGRAERTGADLARLAGACEADARRLADLQEWIRRQAALQ